MLLRDSPQPWTQQANQVTKNSAEAVSKFYTMQNEAVSSTLSSAAFKARGAVCDGAGGTDEDFEPIARHATRHVTHVPRKTQIQPDLSLQKGQRRYALLKLVGFSEPKARLPAVPPPSTT